MWDLGVRGNFPFLPPRRWRRPSQFNVVMREGEGRGHDSNSLSHTPFYKRGTFLGNEESKILLFLGVCVNILNIKQDLFPN